MNTDDKLRNIIRKLCKEEQMSILNELEKTINKEDDYFDVSNAILTIQERLHFEILELEK
jgi:hypothetical protein